MVPYTVDVDSAGAAGAEVGEPPLDCVLVTGQTVVYKAIVSVVTYG